MTQKVLLFYYDEDNVVNYEIEFQDTPGGPLWLVAELIAHNKSIGDDKGYYEDYGNFDKNYKVAFETNQKCLEMFSKIYNIEIFENHG